MKLKTKIIYIVCLINYLSFYSQTSKLSLGFRSSLEINKYYFKEIPNNTNNKYNSIIGASFGIGLKYQISNKSFIESGISYNFQGFNVTHSFPILYPNYNPNQDLNQDYIYKTKSEIKLKYLDIPFKIGTEILNIGRVSFNPSLGVIIQLQINKQEFTYLNNGYKVEREYYTNNLTEKLFSLNFDLGLGYKINENTNIVLIPFINKSITNLDENIMESGKLSYGSSLGIYFRM